MNVKRYRAATMREALEQVKHELGEEALVLDSKKVRAGGFLGLGASEKVEVRVAVDELGTEKNRSDAPAARRNGRLTSLSLSDDRPATREQAAESSERPAGNAFSALAARAYAAEAAGYRAPAGNIDPVRTTPLGVEVATTAPRVVHQRNSLLGQDSSPATAGLPQTKAAPAQRDSVTTELERLRAELREVKFSLNAFSGRAASTRANSQAAQSQADAEIYDSPYYEAYLGLTATGMSADLARQATRAAIALGGFESRDPNVVSRNALAAALPAMVRFEDDPLKASAADSQRPSVIALVGPTGVGKTTTIAKLAARVALKEHRRVELITLDTYRIAAVDQLKTYAEIIGAGCHVPRSILELDALVRRFAGEATVLIDTIGRSPQDLADQIELADYLRANDDMLKCLVAQATTHPADFDVAARKFALYGVNRLVITKLDETSRPGAAIDIAAEAGLPLVYLCAGQRVPEDIEPATPVGFAARVLGANVNHSVA